MRDPGRPRPADPSTLKATESAGGSDAPDALGGPGAGDLLETLRAAASAPARRERPRWLVPGSLALAVLGLLVSVYLTFEHFTGNATLACSVNGVVDCAKVTTSPWAGFLGVPVAVLGLVFFVVLTALCVPPVWRRGEGWLDVVRLGWVTTGLGMVLYLVWAELYRIHAICLWCTVVHVLTFALWVAVLFGQILSGPATRSRR